MHRSSRRLQSKKRRQKGQRALEQALPTPPAPAPREPAADADKSSQSSPQQTRGGLEERLGATAAWAILLASIGVAATTVLIVRNFAARLPIWDHWGPILEASRSGRFTLPYLWAQHNEHRIFIPKLFYLADIVWNRARMSSLYIGILLFQLVTVLLWRLYSKVLGGMAGSSLTAVTGAAIICSFSAAGIEIFLWPFELAFSLLVMFAMISLGSLALHYKSLESGAAPNLWLVLSIASAVCASLSLASGMTLWFVLVLSCIGFRLPWRTTIANVVIAVGFGVVWVQGYVMEAGHTTASFSIRYVIDVLAYAAIYVGSPAVTGGVSVPLIIGIAGLSLACVLLPLALRQRKVPALSLFLWAELLFYLISALFTAMGRIHLGQAQAAASRYQLFSLQFWMALSLLLATAFPPAKRYAVSCAGFCATLGLCPYVHFGAWMEPYVKQGLYLQNASSGLISGVTDMQNLVASHTEAYVLDPGLLYLRIHSLSIWADGDGGAVTSPRSAIPHTNYSNRCEGTIDNQTFIHSFDGPGYRLHGLVWDRNANTSPEKLLVVDDTGTIVGIGRGRQFGRLDNVLSIFKTPREWTAYVSASASGHRVTVLGIIEDNTCIIAKMELTKPFSDLPPRPPLLTRMEAMRPGVFRDGVWFTDSPGGYLPLVKSQPFKFGESGDMPVVGDWDGTGRLRIGVFRKGRWLLDLNGNRAWDGPAVDRETIFGEPGDIPVTGDWDGKGWLRMGVFRNGQWYLDMNGNGLWDGPKIDKLVIYGDRGDYPVVGPWKGSGALRIGVFRRGIWFTDADGNFSSVGDAAFAFGQPGDIPVVARWDSPGPLRIGVFRHGAWLADTNGNDVWDPDSSMTFGQAGDLPVVGPW